MHFTFTIKKTLTKQTHFYWKRQKRDVGSLMLWTQLREPTNTDKETRVQTDSTQKQTTTVLGEASKKTQSDEKCATTTLYTTFIFKVSACQQNWYNLACRKFSLKVEKSSVVVRRAKSLGDVLADGSLFLQCLLLLHAHHVCIPATEQHRQSIKQNTYSLTFTMYREIIVIVTKMYVEFSTEILVFFV